MPPFTSIIPYVPSSQPMTVPPEILMIEDSATDAELTLRAFTRARIANPLTIISSGEDALHYLHGTGPWAKRRPRATARPPLLILLDLQLPRMSGIDFLREIKRDLRTCKIPVVSLSLTKSAPAIVTCIQLGVAKHLIKPVDFKALAQVMKELKLSLTIAPPAAAAGDSTLPRGKAN